MDETRCARRVLPREPLEAAGGDGVQEGEHQALRTARATVSGIEWKVHHGNLISDGSSIYTALENTFNIVHVASMPVHYSVFIETVKRIGFHTRRILTKHNSKY